MDRNLLKYKLEHPPVMSMALNEDHLFRQLYALIRESLNCINELERELQLDQENNDEL